MSLQKKPGYLKNLAVRIGGVAGVFTIIGLIVAIAQLQQGTNNQKQSDIAQATSLAIDQAQLEALEEMVTLQARLAEGTESDAVETSIAAQIEDLKSTLEPGDNEAMVESSTSTIPSAPSPTEITPTSTLTPSITPITESNPTPTTQIDLNGLWDLNYAVYQRINPNGQIYDSSFELLYIVDFSQDGSSFSGEIFGVAGGNNTCTNININGQINGEEISMVWDFVGSCCGGAQSIFSGKISGNSFSGALSPAGRPPSGCFLSWGDISANPTQ